MRVVRYTQKGEALYGIERGEQIIPVTRAFQERHPTVRSVLAANALDEVHDHLDKANATSPDKVRILPPIQSPKKILCVGANYAEHRDEMGHNPSRSPLIFVRFPESHVGHNIAITRPEESNKLDYEGELAVEIGKQAHKVEEEGAMSYVAGFSCFNDLTIRDWQRHSSQFTPGKNFLGVGAMGPALVTRDEANVTDDTRVKTFVNGEELQNGAVGQMIFTIPLLIRYLSTFTVLEPGDIIATGTPAGVGAKKEPPRWLKAGDQVTVTIDGVGSLRNTIIDG